MGFGRIIYHDNFRKRRLTFVNLTFSYRKFILHLKSLNCVSENLLFCITTDINHSFFSLYYAQTLRLWTDICPFLSRVDIDFGNSISKGAEALLCNKWQTNNTFWLLSMWLLTCIYGQIWLLPNSCLKNMPINTQPCLF